METDEALSRVPGWSWQLADPEARLDASLDPYGQLLDPQAFTEHLLESALSGHQARKANEALPVLRELRELNSKVRPGIWVPVSAFPTVQRLIPSQMAVFPKTLLDLISASLPPSPRPEPCFPKSHCSDFCITQGHLA